MRSDFQIGPEDLTDEERGASIRASWEAAMTRRGVPAHLRGGIARYLVDRHPFGHFLTAVFENNLMEAMGRADNESRAGLFNLCQFIYNDAPSPCHGSREKVAKWLGEEIE